MLLAASLPLLVGCQTILGMEPPALRPDASIDASVSTTETNDAAADTQVCPPPPVGCTLFHCASTDGCYYACNGTASWSEAQDDCTQVGCLATIESQAEQDCITATTVPTNGSPVWIGAHQPSATYEPTSGWQWACGSSTFAKWASFEPNDLTGDQDCAELTSSGLWNDVTCSVARRFVCEAR
jgi:hypothetical protein